MPTSNMCLNIKQNKVLAHAKCHINVTYYNYYYELYYYYYYYSNM